MTLDWIISWWNLIFLIPFVLGLMYMGLYLTTGVTFGDGDLEGDADVDSEMDADVDADVDGDVDAHVGGDTDASHGHPTALHPDGTGLGVGLAGLLGIGRVPFSVVLMTLLVMWGLIGMVANNLLWPLLGTPWLLLLVTLPVAAVGSVAVTGAFARLVGRVMPLEESTARPKSHLVGLVGETLYTINETFGMAVVKDAAGERYQVPCRVGPGAAPIEKGRAVLLVDYDRREDFFRVRAYELAEPAEPPETGEGEAKPPAAPARASQRQSASGT